MGLVLGLGLGQFQGQGQGYGYGYGCGYGYDYTTLIKKEGRGEGGLLVTKIKTQVPRYLKEKKEKNGGKFMRCKCTLPLLNYLMVDLLRQNKLGQEGHWESIQRRHY